MIPIDSVFSLQNLSAIAAGCYPLKIGMMIYFPSSSSMAIFIINYHFLPMFFYISFNFFALDFDF